MTGTLLLACGLLATTPTEPIPSASDLAAYQAAKSEARRDPEAHVRLALWCEAHGMPVERMKHLAIAVLADPGHATARGLMGLVADGHLWRKPEELARRAREDAELTANLAEYDAKRARTPNTADGQWDLALWCEDQGLEAEAKAHLSAVVRLEPGREAAWKRLGYKKRDGRWMTDAQVAAEKAEAEAQEQADRRWIPLLETWKGWLSRESKRAEAEAVLAGVSDPLAVRAVWQVFAAGGEAEQLRAAQLLGQIDAPAASRALAVLAVASKSPEARRVAAETLVGRDAREFADMLIGQLRKPIEYEVRPVGGPGSPGELFIEGEKYNRKRLYSPAPPPQIPLLPGDRLALDERGLPVINRFGPTRATALKPPAAALDDLANIYYSGPIDDTIDGLAEGKSGFGAPLMKQSSMHIYPVPMFSSPIFAPVTPSTRFGFLYAERVQIPVGQMMLESQRSATVAQGQLQGDIDAIERNNAEVRRSNERILPILREVAGRDLGEDREDWKRWWVDQVGYAYLPQRYSDNPTFVENVPSAYQPRPIPITRDIAVVGYKRISCFGAGTPVHTLAGTRPIEALEVGDRVLSQDTRTGELGYRPILVVHRNPPSKTFRIRLGGESIVSSEFHRFWRAGEGWAMARELEVGDVIRTLGGLARVEAVEPGEVQPVFNLDVAETASFFVGEGGALVHDNTLPEPALEPFDAPPTLAKAEGPAD